MSSRLSGPEVAITRSFPQIIRRYLSKCPRTSVYTARANGSPLTDSGTGGIYEIPYDNGVGTLSDVKVGYTLDVGTAPGLSDIGKLRVRKSPSGSSFYVNEVAPGTVNVIDNAYLTVREERLIWQKRIRRVETNNSSSAYPIGYTEYIDYEETYSNQNGTGLPPKANITRDSIGSGVLLAGFSDVGQTYRTVTVTGLLSTAMARNAALSGYSWDVGDGTIVSGTASSATITVRFPESKTFRYISLTVTDSNGTTDTMYIPIWVHPRSGGNQPIKKFRVGNDNRSEGREMSFEIWDDILESDLPGGGMICYWEEALFNGQTAPNQYISQFVGWMMSDAVTLKLYRDTYMITVGGPQAILDKLYGYSQTVKDPDANPAKWNEMRYGTIDRMIHYVLRVYTTALSICNFFPSGNLNPIEGKTFNNGTIWSQISELAKGYYGVVSCDSLGGIWLRQHYSYLTTLERTARGYIASIVRSDWTDDRGLEIPMEYIEKVGWVEAYGSNYDVLYDSAGGRVDFSKVFKSEAPGGAQSYGASWEEAPYQYLETTQSAQATLNRLTGNHLARLNNPRSNVSLQLFGNMDIFEVGWGQPILVTVTDDNIRGIELTEEPFIVKSVSVNHSDQGKQITLTLEQATIGEAGKTRAIATDSGASGSTITPVYEPVEYPPSDTAGLKAGTVTIAVFDHTNNKVWITTDFDSIYEGVDPTFVGYSLSLTGLLCSFAVRADSPKYLGGTGAVNGYICTNQQVRTISDIFGARTLGTPQSFTAAIGLQVYLQTERGNPQNAFVLRYYDTGGCAGHATLDGGSSWTAATGLTAFYDTNYLNNTPNWIGGLYMDPRGNGVILTSCHLASASPPGSDFYESVDGGLTFSRVNDTGMSIDNYNARCIVRPLNRPEDVVFFGNVQIVVNPQCRIYRTMAGVRTDISPTFGGEKYGVDLANSGGTQRSISLADDDDNCIVFVGNNNTGVSSKHGVFQSYDALAATPTWTALIEPEASVPYRGAYYVDRNTIFLYGNSGSICVLKKVGASWQKYETVIPGAGILVGLCGG